MTDLTGRVAIVTGAGKQNGIGYAACSRLVAAGCRVILTDLARDDAQRARLDELASGLGELCTAQALGVTDGRRATSVVERVRQAHGRVDILFNNAGTPAGAGAFLELDDGAWDQSYEVNLKGMVNLCRAVIPLMQAQGRGAIINNASLAGLGAIAGLSPYIATKFAVVGLTKALAVEYGGEGIRCNAVCPGLVWTDMGRLEVEHMKGEGQTVEEAKKAMAAEVPMERWADPGEVGDAVVFLASDQSSYINGVALPVAGGLAPGL